LAILTSRKAPPDLQKSPSRPPHGGEETEERRQRGGDSGEEGVSG